MEIALMLLGFGKTILKKFWPYILVLILILTLGSIIFHEISTIKKKAFDEGQQQGVQIETNYIKQVVAQNDKQNRATEVRISTSLNDFAKKFNAQRANDRAQEQKHADKVVADMNKNPVWSSPTCSVGDDVLKERNAIRHQGWEDTK